MIPFNKILNNPYPLLLLLSPSIIIGLYCFFIRKIKMNHNQLILISCIFLIIYFLLPIYIVEMYMYNMYSFDDRILLSVGLCFTFITGTFYGIESYFKRAWLSDDELFEKLNNPKYDTKIVGFYPNSYRVKVIAFFSRYSIFTFGTLALIWFILDNLKKEVGFNIETESLTTCLGLLAAIIFFNISFLRILNKCPNCHLEIFFIDRLLHSHVEVAKRVLKEDVVECWHCHAAYALDPNMDLDQLRKDNIKNWDERMEKKRILEEKRKASQ